MDGVYLIAIYIFTKNEKKLIDPLKYNCIFNNRYIYMYAILFWIVFPFKSHPFVATTLKQSCMFILTKTIHRTSTPIPSNSPPLI